MKTINNYAELVKAQHALNKTLAPVETDLTGASQDYAKGAKFIYNGIMNQAKTDIAQGDALVLNTNYEAAPDVETQIANEAATRSALGAKNLVDIADFTLVKSSDRTKTINAADIEDIPSTQVILSFDVTNSDLTQDGAFRAYGPSVGGSRTLIGDTSFKSNGTYELSFDATTFDQFYIFIDNSDSENATCTISNIMVRLATDSDGTYQPYAKTNKELTDNVSSLNTAIANQVDEITDINNVLGAKNLFKNPFSSTTTSGVTATVGVDGTVTLNGTATDSISFVLTQRYGISGGKAIIPNGKYIGNGCPSGGGLTSYRLRFIYTKNSSYIEYYDTGDGVEFTLNGDDGSANSVEMGVQILIPSGTVCNNLVFKPMIRPANISDGTYVPYAKTNRELTEDIASGYLLSTAFVNVTVTADGIKTYGELLTELFAKVNTIQQEENYESFIFAWLAIDDAFALNVNGLRPYARSATTTFLEVGSASSSLKLAHIEFKASNSVYRYAEIGSSVTFTDKTSTVPAVNSVITARIYKCVPQNIS